MPAEHVGASLRPEVRSAIANKEVLLVTSQRTAQLSFVNDVIKVFRRKFGIPLECVFTQQNIDKAEANEHWATQWTKAAESASEHGGRVLCFVDRGYLDSNACCLEYLTAQDVKIAVIVVLEPLSVLKAKKSQGHNGRLLMHLRSGGQCLLAHVGAEFSDPAVLAESLFEQLCMKSGSAVTLTAHATAHAGEALTALESLDVDETRELCAHMRVKCTDATMDGARLPLLDDDSLYELDTSLKSPRRRKIVLQKIAEYAGGGVPAPLMKMVRATVLRVRGERAEEERLEAERAQAENNAEKLERDEWEKLAAAEREARAWLASKGWPDDLLTASAIDLSGRELTDADAPGIVLLLACNESLAQLDLRGNALGDVGASRLGSALGANTSLTELNLHANQISDVGTADLCKGLKANGTLACLDLDANKLTDASAPVLAAMLKANGSLAELDVLGNKLLSLNASKAAIKVAWRAKADRDESDLGGGRLERQWREREERERLRREEAERQAREQKEREEAEQQARERKEREAAERLRREEAERLQALQQERKEAVRKQRLRQEREEAARQQRERAERLERERQRLQQEEVERRAPGRPQRERELGTWLAKRGWGKGMRTAAIINQGSKGLTDAHMLGFALLLEFNASLTALDLCWNRIAGPGAVALGEALAVNASLTELDLYNNKIADAGAAALGKALEVNASLTKLNLWNNMIADAGAIGLGKALAVNASLTELVLRFNKFADAGAIGLGKALEVNASLTTLSLQGNKIGYKGAIGLAEGLKVNASLTMLDLGYNQIADAGVIGLGKALEVNASLTVLDLEYNKIADAGAIGLGKALEVNASLTKLDLEYNKIGDAGKRAVRAAWKGPSAGLEM